MRINLHQKLLTLIRLFPSHLFKLTSELHFSRHICEFINNDRQQVLRITNLLVVLLASMDKKMKSFKFASGYAAYGGVAC